MAASGWSYLVEFDGNADALLAALHELAFEQCDFQVPSIDPSFLDDVTGKDWIVSQNLPNALGRWQAVYIPVYTGAEITYAYVEGASGD